MSSWPEVAQKLDILMPYGFRTVQVLFCKLSPSLLCH